MLKNRFAAFGKSRMVRNAGWLIGGNIAYKLVAFIVGLATARYLGPGNYGLINYAAAYTTFFLSFATLGINAVIVKLIIDDRAEEGTTLGTAIVLQGISGLLSAFTILGVVFFVDYGESVTVAVVFLSSLALYFQSFEAVKFWFQSRLESKYASVATIIAYILTSLYRVILLVLGKSVTWFALASSVDYVCIAVILFICYKRKGGPRLRFSRTAARRILASSRYYILSGLMVAVYGATDKFMLKHMLGEEAVGYYGTALAICNTWAFVLTSVIESMNPVILELAGTDRAEYRRKNVQMYAIIFYMATFVSIGATILAGPGVELLYGEAYAGAAMPLRIVTWYVAFLYMGAARDTWVNCENAQRYLPWIYMGAALANVLLNLVLIPRFGASGAAAASLVTQISTVFIIPLLFKALRPNVKMMLEAVALRGVIKK